MQMLLKKKFSVPHTSSRGFTLIEMIISTSIFIIIVLVIVGSLVSIDDASRKARTIRVVSDNLSAAIDSMSRNVRMGSAIHCGCGTAGDTNFPDGRRDCPMTDALGGGGDVCLAFEGQNGDNAIATDQIVYRLSGNRIDRSKDGGATYVELTAPEITINNLRFFVYGSTQNQDQPVVTMLIRGVAPLSAKTMTDFNVQTTVSARTPNF